MPLTADPQLGTRAGWDWCADCQALKEPGHIHGDPLEELTRAELLEKCRELQLYLVLDDVGSTRFEALLAHASRRRR